MKDDLTLLKALKEGDKAALSSLYDKYSPALFGVIIRICRKKDLAEDILQETFLKIWEKSDAYDPEKGKFYTWAYRIARNNAINALRNRGYLIQNEDLSVYKERADDEQEEFEFEKLDGSLSKLEQHHQKAIQLIYYQGLTHREAHKVMDVPLGTFKSYVRQALRELRLSMDNLQIIAILIMATV